MGSETVRTCDIPSSVLQETALRLTHYSVGLVKISSPDEAMLGGSGTLVKVGEHHAILTAAHVVETLWTAAEFGVVLSRLRAGKPHRITIEKRYARQIVIPRDHGLAGSEPPDIALIIIPEGLCGSIKAVKSFYNLDYHMRSESPEQKLGFWALCGFAEEWTRDYPNRSGFEKVLAFNGRILWGFAEPSELHAGADAWSMTFQRTSDYDGPISFGGYSGGGLWQNLIGIRGEELRLRSSALSGVAYYQTGFEDDANTILFNGRRCIRRLTERI